MDNLNTVKKEDLYEMYKNETCPVCGYYCNGNGGIGCIDKPALCGLDRETLADKLYISKRIQGEKR